MRAWTKKGVQNGSKQSEGTKRARKRDKGGVIVFLVLKNTSMPTYINMTNACAVSKKK